MADNNRDKNPGVYHQDYTGGSFPQVPHTLEPGISYMTQAGNILTIECIDEGRAAVQYVRHPDQLRWEAEYLTQPIYIFLEWLAVDYIRQISNVQDLSTPQIIRSWDSIACQDYTDYLW